MYLAMELKQLEKISKALSDINRLKILADMSACGGSLQCSQIMDVTELAQPSVSHHIKTLIEAGLIEAEKEGRSHTYLLNKELLKEYSKELAGFCGKIKLPQQ
jgi:ArsR family transcriptional regulator, arsenate/arsenite/antimonite-responsive transcriptional repressor